VDLSIFTDLFQQPVVPLDELVTEGVSWLVANFRDFFQTLRHPVNMVLGLIEGTFRSIPPTLTMLIFFCVSWQTAGLRVGFLSIGIMFTVGFIGAWVPAMTSLAIVITSVLFCGLIGIPIGISAAKCDWFETLLKPVLDLMQTIPSFVYLVPIVLLFGVGNVPGVMVTTIYALPPICRLTNLGIRQVTPDLVEAATAFGSSPVQKLLKIELPLALPMIMAGLNQSVMMCLTMSVISSMISVDGLGRMVLVGIYQLDMSLAAVGGVGIVVLAIVIDRFTQGLGLSKRDRGFRTWYQVGPLGLALRLVNRGKMKRSGSRIT
jgi:glycine betaine/proline transport system permease protein